MKPFRHRSERQRLQLLRKMEKCQGRRSYHPTPWLAGFGVQDEPQGWSGWLPSTARPGTYRLIPLAGLTPGMFWHPSLGGSSGAQPPSITMRKAFGLMLAICYIINRSIIINIFERYAVLIDDLATITQGLHRTTKGSRHAQVECARESAGQDSVSWH